MVPRQHTASFVSVCCRFYNLVFQNIGTSLLITVITVMIIKIEQNGFRYFCDVLKISDGMANSVDPDLTAPAGAVGSGSTLFAQMLWSHYSESLHTPASLRFSHTLLYLISTAIFIPLKIDFHSRADMQKKGK